MSALSTTSPEVIVIGGGIAGSTVAWRFAKAGAKVELFDCERAGAATPAAGGILCAQVESAHAAVPSTGDAGDVFLDLLLAAEDAHRQLAATLGAERLGYRPSGVLQVALTEQEAALLEAERTRQRARGLPVERLDAATLRRLEPTLSESVLEASHFSRGAQVDNRALLAVLRAEAVASGVVFRDAMVTGVTHVGQRVTGVSAAGAEVPAGQVVVAAGAWSGLLDGVSLGPPKLRPVRGQMLELRAEGAVPSRVVFGAGGYLVPRADRVLVGSTMEEAGFTVGVTADALDELRQRAAKLAPALATAPRADAWSGFRPATVDGLPAIGPTPIDGLHLAVGFLRNGILLAPLCAQWVVDSALAKALPVPPPFAAARLFA